MKKNYNYMYLLVFVVLCSFVTGCQQDREEPFSGEKPSPSVSVDSRVSELLNALNMYRFDTVQKAPSFELMSVTETCIRSLRINLSRSSLSTLRRAGTMC
jgi:hypothetical protein